MNNRRRVLAELVSIDAWHEPFHISQGSYGVHVELSFHEARLGSDDPESPVTFRACLRRALLIVSIESPLRIDRASIARSIPIKQAEHTKILRAKNQVRSEVGMKTSIEPRKLAAAVGFSASIESDVSREDEIRFVQTLPETIVTARPQDGMRYRWDMEPSLSDHLSGQPWDPIEAPRMKVILPKTIGIDPAIKVEIRCAREDLVISDIELKDKSMWSQLESRVRGDLSDATAVQHLKNLLIGADLEPGDIDNRFHEIILADLFAADS